MTAPAETKLQRAEWIGRKSGTTAAQRFVDEAKKDLEQLQKIVPKLRKAIETRVRMLAVSGWSRQEADVWANAYIAGADTILIPYFAEIEAELNAAGV